MSCQFSCDESDSCDLEPSLGAGDGCVELLRQAPVSVGPGEGLLDDPVAGPELEALRGVGALNDFQRPRADPLEGAAQFRSGIAAVGEDMAQPRVGGADRGQHIGP